MPDCPALPPPALLPMVTIHVPTCNEPPDRVRRLLAALAALDYPAFEVLVVDHNTSDPALWEPVARDCARHGARFQFFHLGYLPSGRAGALNFARAQANGRAEVVAVLDAGTVVARNWLRGVMPGFANPRVGVVRSPYLMRTAALDSVGGWAEWAMTEDTALDLALLQGRWLSAEAGVPCASSPADFAMQRWQTARRAYGAAQIGRRCWRRLFSPFDRELTFRQRCRFIAGWLPSLNDALSLLLLIVNLTLLIGLSLTPWRFGLPVVLAALAPVGLLACRLGSRRTDAATTGLALSHTVARAFWNGLLGGSAPGLHPHPPGWTDGLVREEAVLLLLSWAALAGIAAAHGLAVWQAVLWCVVLLAQSAPYLAAMTTTALAARPEQQPRVFRRAVGAVARTGAGD